MNMDNQTESKKNSFFDTPIGKIVYVLVICFVVYILNEACIYGEHLIHPIFKNMAQSFYDNGNGYWGDFISTFGMYFIFIADWIIMMLVIIIPKHNRYMLKKVLPGGGNRISLLFAGLALGFLMNMTCAGVAMLNEDIKLSFYDFSVIPFILMLAAVFIKYIFIRYFIWTACGVLWPAIRDGILPRLFCLDYPTADRSSRIPSFI